MRSAVRADSTAPVADPGTGSARLLLQVVLSCTDTCDECLPLVFAKNQDRAYSAIFRVTDADAPGDMRHLNAAITVYACCALMPRRPGRVLMVHLQHLRRRRSPSQFIEYHASCGRTLCHHGGAEGGHTVSEDATQPGHDPSDRRTGRRLLLAAAALLAIAAFLIGTPYLLLAIGHVRHNDWTQFSSEGQAYGGIAAVLGMLALVGVAASRVLQSREAAARLELA